MKKLVFALIVVVATSVSAFGSEIGVYVDFQSQAEDISGCYGKLRFEIESFAVNGIYLGKVDNIDYAGINIVYKRNESDVEEVHHYDKPNAINVLTSRYDKVMYLYEDASVSIIPSSDIAQPKINYNLSLQAHRSHECLAKMDIQLVDAKVTGGYLGWIDSVDIAAIRIVGMPSTEDGYFVKGEDGKFKAAFDKKTYILDLEKTVEHGLVVLSDITGISVDELKSKSIKEISALFDGNYFDGRCEYSCTNAMLAFQNALKKDPYAIMAIQNTNQN